MPTPDVPVKVRKVLKTLRTCVYKIKLSAGKEKEMIIPSPFSIKSSRNDLVCNSHSETEATATINLRTYKYGYHPNGPSHFLHHWPPRDLTCYRRFARVSGHLEKICYYFGFLKKSIYIMKTVPQQIFLKRQVATAGVDSTATAYSKRLIMLLNSLDTV